MKTKLTKINLSIFVFLVLLFSSVYLIFIFIEVLKAGDIFVIILDIIFLSTMLISFIYLIITGYFSFIQFDGKSLSYKKYKYDIDKVYVTAVPVLTKSWHYGYYLLIGDKYYYNLEIPKKIKTGFYICLYPKVLEKLLTFYDKKIMIMDKHGYETNELVSSKKLKEMVYNHNKLADKKQMNI